MSRCLQPPFSYLKIKKDSGFHTLDGLIAIIILGLALQSIHFVSSGFRRSVDKQRIAVFHNIEYITERENASWTYTQKEPEKE